MYNLSVTATSTTSRPRFHSVAVYAGRVLHNRKNYAQT